MPLTLPRPDTSVIAPLPVGPSGRARRPDTHEGQTWRLPNQLRTVSAGIAAFDADLADLPRRWSVLVVSAFGRRLRANASGGTDHGRAGTVMAIAGHGGALGGHVGA